MASSKKFGVQFEGFEEVMGRLKKLEADVPKVTERALEATHAYVTPQLHSLMHSHNRTGNTERSIEDNAKVEWTGTVGKIDVGFDISNGGLPSIFLMYGTPRHKPNHPGQNADTKLKNAIFGNKTKNEIMKIQEDIFYEEIRRLNG